MLRTASCFVSLVCTTIGLGAPARAQQQLAPQGAVHVALAPPRVLQLFDVMSGTLQELSVPFGNPAAAAIDVVLAGQPAVLDLNLFDVRAPGFQLLERGANGVQQLPTPACVTYRGSIRGESGSIVAATIVDASLTAYVRRATGELWLVQPLREVQPQAAVATHVVYRQADSANLPYHCGVPGVVSGPVAPAIGEDTTYEAQLALEADYPLYQLNGSNTTNTQNDVTGIVNAMEVIYTNDVQISFQVSQLLIDSVPDPYTTNVAGTLLTQFRNYWNANYNYPRDLAHLLSGRPLGASSGGTIGVAYLSTVCNLAAAYGVSESHFSANYGYRVAVTAHEIGHNFGASHCDSVSPCIIMCSAVGSCGSYPSSFGPTEQSQIISFRQTLGCLTLNTGVPQLTSLMPAQVATVNPGQITLTGSGFTGATAVHVGTQTITSGLQIVSDSQLRFIAPPGLPIGFQITNVTNPVGTSNNLAIWYQGANPCQLVVQGGVVGGNILTWTMGGWPTGTGYLGISFVNTTSPFQGWQLLDGFILLWAGPLDPQGMASLPVPVPAGLLSGITVYSQMLDEITGTGLLRSLSTVKSTLIIL